MAIASRRTSLWLFFLLIVAASLESALSGNKAKKCHQLFFVDSHWTDYRPDVAVNMSFNDDGSIVSHTIVNKPITQPVTIITLSQDMDGRITTLYNITTKLCEIDKLMNRMPIVKSLMDSSMGNSNYSLSCPVDKGLYVMRVLFDERNRLLGFIYRPNVQFLLRGGLFDTQRNGSLLPMSTYDVVIRVVKRACIGNRTASTKRR